ncbi:MAG: hypothetical protein ABSA16_11630 [Thermoguttaceae bacterium]|jgi:hypothetical protein
MVSTKNSVPKYCLHKGSGQAYVKIKGKRFYLGLHGTTESKGRYFHFIAELAATPLEVSTIWKSANDLTITELIATYWQHAESYYQKNGCPSRHLHAIRVALKRLRTLYGDIPAADFSPRSLKTLRETIIEAGYCRRYVNKQIELIRQMFRWGASEELVPILVYQGLTTVVGLRMGRSAARETKPIGPVADDVVEATLPYLPPVINDMVRLQRLTGMHLNCRTGRDWI